MTYPRSHLIDTENPGFYHLMSRCVRRAWLCGDDILTGRNFDHRREWIENRILQLGEIFSVAIYGYAVMSNHYHLVLKVDPIATNNWSDQEIAERWLQLCPPKKSGQEDKTTLELSIKALLLQPDRIQVLRQRLGSLSWLMRFINEPLARLANQEDQCTGRFWEGRFQSKVLLDEASLLACNVYVDLNPIRAGMAEELASSDHTSIRHRLQKASGYSHCSTTFFGPLVTAIENDEKDLDMTLVEYVALVEWTAGINLDQRGNSLPKSINKILKSLSQSETLWIQSYTAQKNPYQRAFGSVEKLKAYARKIGQQWIQCRYPLLVSGQVG